MTEQTPQQIIERVLSSFIRKKGPIILMDVQQVAIAAVIELVAEKKARLAGQQEVANEAKPVAATTRKPERKTRPISLSGMASGDAESAIAQAISIMEMCEEVPSTGKEFAQSVADRTADIAANIERNMRVTPGQQDALDNMERGVQGWLRE
jgi:hypothetical protein